jgi:hypothetical protein
VSINNKLEKFGKVSLERSSMKFTKLKLPKILAGLYLKIPWKSLPTMGGRINPHGSLRPLTSKNN